MGKHTSTVLSLRGRWKLFFAANTFLQRFGAVIQKEVFLNLVSQTVRYDSN